MKTMIGLMMVVMVAGCAGHSPVWQQELNNINRQWREPAPVVIPPQSYVTIRDEYIGVNGLVCD